MLCIRMVNSIQFVVQTCRKPNKQDGHEKIFSLGSFKFIYIFSLSIKRSRLTVILFVPISNVRFRRSLWRCGQLWFQTFENRTGRNQNKKSSDFEWRSDLIVRISSRYCSLFASNSKKLDPFRLKVSKIWTWESVFQIMSEPYRTCHQ